MPARMKPVAIKARRTGGDQGVHAMPQGTAGFQLYSAGYLLMQFGARRDQAALSSRLRF